MSFNELEKIFNRALLFSFSKKKFFLVCPVLILCGMLVIFLRALSFNFSDWTVMSLIFLAIFLSSGILLALGVLLVRIYYHEVKDLKLSYREIFKNSWEIIVGTSYLSVPVLLAYLLLWIVFGIFVLLKEIPYLGQIIGVVLSFAPFLIILVSLVLCILNAFLLFFVSPAIALKNDNKINFTKDIFEKLPKNLLPSLIFWFFGFLPIAVVVGLLTLAAFLTNISYLVSTQLLSITLQWFFIMIPYAALLSFAVIFFFNFAAEAYNWLKVKGQ